MSGGEGWENMEDYGTAKEAWLRRFYRWYMVYPVMIYFGGYLSGWYCGR